MNGTLDDLYNLLYDKSRWIKHGVARKQDGTFCSKIADGYSFCLVGAVSFVNLDQASQDKLYDLILKKHHGYAVTFNDSINTTHEMVLEVIDEARKIK